jgi:signal transduction histidine kinase
MENVLSSMEEGVVLVGPTGRVRLSNPAAERLLGTRPLTASRLLPVAFQEAARKAAVGGAAVGVEVETGSPSRWTRATAIPVGDDGSVLLVVRDVTEARRLEAVRRDFVANASHELKTPAASIQAAGETIRSAVRDDPSVIPRFAEQLEREAIRLSRIVSELLDLSRLETGHELDEDVGLDQVVKEERERFEEAAHEGGLTLSIDLGSVPPVRGSARDLSLLVRNLVDNAIRYTKPGGRVDVSVMSDGGEVVLSVADTGVGIPTRELPRIFERFYRVDRARSRETGGTGLGLSIVKHVVENHGGTVSVTSELGRGTCFEVRLPAAPS